jgi:hypothetical protein
MANPLGPLDSGRIFHERSEGAGTAPVRFVSAAGFLAKQGANHGYQEN